MTQTFPSKIDTWLIVVLALSLVPAVFGMASALRTGGPVEDAFVMLTLAFGLGLPVWVLARTDYTVSPDTLLIRSGPFRWRLPTRTIVEIRATHNPLSAPALSLDRLEILTTRGRAIRVSPDEQDAFCAALTHVNPDIRVLIQD